MARASGFDFDGDWPKAIGIGETGTCAEAFRVAAGAQSEYPASRQQQNKTRSRDPAKLQPASRPFSYQRPAAISHHAFPPMHTDHKWRE